MAVVVGNRELIYHLYCRAMTHDPQTYSDPDVFKPERFLAVGGHIPELDPRMAVFGFSRR